MALPKELQMELVEKAAAKYGNCQELAKHLNIPKSSVHYYRAGRLTMPASVLEAMIEIADDPALETKVRERGITKDRSWATEHAQDVFREMCRDRVQLPTIERLETDVELRAKAAAIVSYVLAEGSVWMQKRRFGEHAVNITFGGHEGDLYENFRSLCREVFRYDIGPSQHPGNGADAIRGFIYSRFVAEWMIENGVPPGDKAMNATNLPRWVMSCSDPRTWISALQPWCDGEGCVIRGHSRFGAGFSLAQSRHTDLDLHTMPCGLATDSKRRVISRETLRNAELFGVPALGFCSVLYRSDVFDDVFELLRRLRFHPTMRISSMYLKNDGFWSCTWIISISQSETKRLAPMGLVTQREKRSALEPSKLV